MLNVIWAVLMIIGIVSAFMLNKTDILICKINDKDDEVIRLAKYLRTDENLSNIKLVVLSEIPEYEIIRDEKDFGYTYYQKITEYSQESFVNVIMKI